MEMRCFGDVGPLGCSSWMCLGDQREKNGGKTKQKWEKTLGKGHKNGFGKRKTFYSSWFCKLPVISYFWFY